MQGGLLPKSMGTEQVILLVPRAEFLVLAAAVEAAAKANPRMRTYKKLSDALAKVEAW